ncbi:glycosyltransferase [Stutzerimonas stutzeri]|uniref:glycosyltransferase n=1 Tax=Stutzerimonas stutzeri TaxID=316 RepID=UPI00210CA133|nr:glycosyltransferase [Stutzerimonas stutzeri]MCQ4321762.1 glycosyltransferase [Stutzerimonas stutzeri]
MKIAILSSASAGGAGIAAYRVYEALSRGAGFEVDFFDIDILGQVDTEVSPTHSASNGKITNTHFTVDYATEPRQWLIDFLDQYDVLNIHWASYLLSLCEILRLVQRGKQILFTLHDFHYITGGCHYPAGCLGFQASCVGCPQLNDRKCDPHTVINTLKLKREIFSHENVHLAAPSAFIVDSAIRSGIVPPHRGHVLRNAYNPPLPFEPRGWGDKRSILLIADSFNEQRKGLQLAVDALKLAFSSDKAQAYQLELHLVGGMDHQVISQLNDLPVRIITHGHIKQHEKLVNIFKQCQFILTCSYEDNWPNILVEAGSYGCLPIVGKWHGCEEFARQFESPYIAESYTPQAFSVVINEALATLPAVTFQRQGQIVDAVRRSHAYSRVAEKYIETMTQDKPLDVVRAEVCTADNSGLISADRLLATLPQMAFEEISAVKKATPFGCQNPAIRELIINVSYLNKFSRNDKHEYGIVNILV